MLNQKAATAAPGTTVYVEYWADYLVTVVALPAEEVDAILQQMYDNYLQSIEELCSNSESNDPICTTEPIAPPAT